MSMCQSHSNRKQQRKRSTELTISNVATSISDLTTTDFNSIVFAPTTSTMLQYDLSTFNDELSEAVTSSMNPLWSDPGCEVDFEYTDTDDSNLEAPPAEKIAKVDHSYNQTPSTTVQTVEKPRKLPGPRPRRPIEELTPIEAERRCRRRERNKNAAAKCRQRRIDVTNELLEEAKILERESAKLEEEIENLRRQKNQLEFVLESHKPSCNNNSLKNFNTGKENSLKNFDIGNMICLPYQPSQPNSLPLSVTSTCANNVTHPALSSAASVFSFEQPNVLDFLLSTDISPTACLLSPSVLLAQ